MSARMRNHIEPLKPLRLFILANEPTSKRLEASLRIQYAAAKGGTLQENRPVNDYPIFSITLASRCASYPASERHQPPRQVRL